MKFLSLVATFFAMTTSTVAQSDLDAVYLCDETDLPQTAQDLCTALEEKLAGQNIEQCTCTISFTSLISDGNYDTYCVSCQKAGVIAIPQFGNGDDRRLHAESYFAMKFNKDQEVQKNHLSVRIPKDLAASPITEEQMHTMLQNSSVKLFFDGCACTMESDSDEALCTRSPQCESRFAQSI